MREQVSVKTGLRRIQREDPHTHRMKNAEINLLKMQNYFLPSRLRLGGNQLHLKQVKLICVSMNENYGYYLSLVTTYREAC